MTNASTVYFQSWGIRKIDLDYELNNNNILRSHRLKQRNKTEHGLVGGSDNISTACGTGDRTREGIQVESMDEMKCSRLLS